MVIGDALDSVKTTRYQIGTFSHLSEDVDHFLEGVRVWAEQVELFFTNRKHAALVAASIIIASALVNHFRGWFKAHYRG
jgi:hypothetical protein